MYKIKRISNIKKKNKIKNIKNKKKIKIEIKKPINYIYRVKNFNINKITLSD